MKESVREIDTLRVPADVFSINDLFKVLLHYQNVQKEKHHPDYYYGLLLAQVKPTARNRTLKNLFNELKEDWGYIYQFNSVRFKNGQELLEHQNTILIQKIGLWVPQAVTLPVSFDSFYRYYATVVRIIVKSFNQADFPNFKGFKSIVDQLEKLNVRNKIKNKNTLPISLIELDVNMHDR